MDAGITECLYYLGKALSKTRYKVQTIKPCQDWYKVREEDREHEYMKEVAEITFQNGDVIYADIGCDSNSAAIKDVMYVVDGDKKQSSKIERLVYIEK